MTSAPPPPYADLDHARVVDALEALGFACDGRVLALNSYENRVYRVGLDDGAPVVAKFYRPQRWSDAAILEEHAFAFELRDAGISVVAPLRIDGESLHHCGEHRLAVFPLQGGRAPESGDRDTLRRLGRALAQIHNTGATQPFVHRPVLSIESHGDVAVEYLLEHDWLPPELRDNFVEIADAVLDRAEAAWDVRSDLRMLRTHGDCHLGNLLWRDGDAHFVDLDDCMTAPAVQDVWMLLSGNADDQRRQFDWLMEGYLPFREFDARELGLIETLRSLRLLHYHGWIARRWKDPAFPAAFPWFDERRHWESLIAQLQEQLAVLQEVSAWAE